ncbi:MAG: prephenate dehydratase [Bryobacteraceae bacterium]
MSIEFPRRIRRVAFQGELGAFSHLAILKLVGSKAKPVPCQRFEQLFTAVIEGKADAAMLPVENTLHGSVHENYDLLLQYRLPIVAETNVRIVHNLIANPGVKFRDIRKVYSHPVALNQCLEFFKRNPQAEKAAWYDTAGSIKMLAEEKPEGAAGIASSLAAATYGCEILKAGIEDDRQNYTRFFLLAKKPIPFRSPPHGYKTSLAVTMPNVPGSLFRVLAALALRDISLCKLETRPWKGRRWEYLFYIDFLGDVREERVANALRHLGEVTDSLVVLGCYPRGD